MKHNGYEVELNSMKRFHVDELSEDFESWNDAVAAINKAVSVKKSVAKKNLDIAVVSESGTKHKITGLHMGTGAILYTPKKENRFGRHHDLYPDVDWISAAIKTREQLHQQANDIKDVLDKFEIKSPNPGYGRADPEQYPAYMQKLEDNAKALIAKAKATDLAKELAK